MGSKGQRRAASGADQGTLAPWLGWSSLLGTVANAALALRHSLRARGGVGTALFAALGLGLPTLGEWYAVNIDRSIRHHSQPQARGVPVNAALGWWTIASATHALTDDLLARAGASARVRRWSIPVGTALVATSLDLVLDPFGLANGYWEWRDGGTYARDIVGSNGRSGIPIGNYVAWIALTSGVSALYGALARNAPPRNHAPGTAREAARILLPYYLPAALWAIRERRPRYLLTSALFPVAVTLALWPRRPEAGSA
jgi:uncharacterized membrane protein